jgi:hypothetical protein
MSGWLRGAIIAVVFTVVGAFAASLWLEIQRESVESDDSVPGVWEGRRIRVEVLNGGGVAGAANQATERLRGLAFDVVHYGNLDQFETDNSYVIARIDEVEPALRAADALGILEIVREPDLSLSLDVTVVLGEDWSPPVDSVAYDDVGPIALWMDRFRRAAGRLWPG